ncbi:hypothetical protein PZ938_05470 [Luteipulveratus sp. YIM 133132]|uniref:Uncharacterized protein n=1 Tax=Luteipulveratus flavus TaxID=3031728 RepID=A0ABT6C763_9MICO|nr:MULTISPECIES: hypothetical protein [unclassified Luteipulveratus]MDE9365050.1 hypothetical protein [Luteipulveratus sp. YIM 133132]MDF8264610.1 hypothetical protein [Luteipulveratus sp. YIM 133296]
MGAGIGLIVFGAILAFAVKADAKIFDIQTAGVILMVAGIAIVAINYYGRRLRRTTMTEILDVDEDGREVRRTIREDEGEDTTT